MFRIGGGFLFVIINIVKNNNDENIIPNSIKNPIFAILCELN